MADDNTVKTLREIINENRQQTQAIISKLDENDKTNKESSKAMKQVGGVLKDDLKGFTDSITAPFKAFTSAIPGLSSMGKIAGILASSAAANKASGAKEVETKREAERAAKKQTTLLAQIAGGIMDLKDSFLKGLKEGAGMGLGAIAALLAAPIITIVEFFKTLSQEIKFLNQLTKGRLAKIFSPLAKFFSAVEDILTKGGTGRFLKGNTARVFGRFTDTLVDMVGKIRRIFRPIMAGARNLRGFMRTFEPIAKFARGIGRILGRFFLPVTVLMTAWDTIKGAIAGYETDGWLGAIEGGITGLINSVIGFPLDLVKSGVEWLLKKVGWDEGAAVLAGFSFSDTITKIVGAFFDVISSAWTWIKSLWTDPVAALTTLWTGLVGVWTGFGNWIYTNAIEPTWNYIKGLWSGAVEGIQGLWTGLVGVWTDLGTYIYNEALKPAWDWIKGIWSGAVDGITALWTAYVGVWTDLGSWIYNTALKPVWDWLSGLWVNPVEGITALWNAYVGVWTGIGGWVYDNALKPVWDWVSGIFSFGDEDKAKGAEFSLWDTIKGALNKIWDWFSQLFDIDINAVIRSIPGAETLLSWFSADEQDKALAEATESGLYDKDWAGASEINRDMVAQATRAQLEAIIADNDLRESDKSFILDELQRRASGGAVSAATPYLVGEAGPELFVPSGAGSVLSAGRTERLFQGASEANALARGGSSAAPVVINNAPTTNMSSGGGRGGSVFPVSVGDPDPKFRMVAANAF